jgi:two-component system OmpR family response regulator
VKVLLIDDEEDIRKIGKLCLEVVGKHQVATAASALDGLRAAMSDRPDVILMDMMMPGMDGLSALVELQRTPALKDVPVLFMTAKVQRSEVAHYLALGAAGVIPKPFDPMRLPEEIRALLASAAVPPL